MTEQLQIPSSATLAKRVTDALAMMFDGTVSQDPGYTLALPQLQDGRVVTVPLIGAVNYVLTLQARENGGAALASAMFSCARNLTTDAMIEDAMCELANMVAGQVRAMMARDHQIGVPSFLNGEDMLSGARGLVGARLRIGDHGAYLDVMVADYKPALTQSEAEPVDQRPSVAIAEDDEITLQFVKAAVESAGMRVVMEARNGFQALNEIRRLQPDVVCLDINMPEMTGLEVLAALRQESPTSIVFLISSFATMENVREAIQLRASGIIVKPFMKARIVGEIQKALTARRKSAV